MRWTSACLSSCSSLAAASTIRRLCPHRPTVRTCGNIVDAQTSRTFLTLSAARAAKGLKITSTRQHGGASLTTASHIRMNTCRWLNCRDFAKVRKLKRKRSTSGTSALWVASLADPPLEPSQSLPVLASSNSCGATTRKTQAVALAAVCRTSATVSEQSFINNGTITDHAKSSMWAGVGMDPGGFCSLAASSEGGSAGLAAPPASVSSAGGWTLPGSGFLRAELPEEANSSQISDSNLASKCRIRQFAGFDFSCMPPTIFRILLCGEAPGAKRKMAGTFLNAANRTSSAGSCKSSSKTGDTSVSLSSMPMTSMTTWTEAAIAFRAFVCMSRARDTNGSCK
mmetsp:Transcript_11193/g.20383  ORF Transcript_11193/g.20383 Transcript_11193/m.20383 type:complete len:340 (+) Transcript_11193:1340-2359(+)